MKNYESIIITNPQLSTDELEKLCENIKKQINDNNGEMKGIKHLGKKRLAYRIKKFNEGIYLQIEFLATGECVKNLERFYRMNEDIIRFLTVKC